MDFQFLCGKFSGNCFVYAIRSKKEKQWWYFKEGDTLIDEQPEFLKTAFQESINCLEQSKIQVFDIKLNEDQFTQYGDGVKFSFKGEQLQNYMQLSSLASSPQNRNSYKSAKTEDLLFIQGETNPSKFLIQFEKAIDVRSDSDKLFKIRNFVHDEHRRIFSSLYLKGQWQSARQIFLEKYSRVYTCNKKRAVAIKFENQSSLREFVHKKMLAFTRYTQVKNVQDQIDIILSELPNEISNLFLIKDKVNGSMEEILEFCDVIQDQVEIFNEKSSDLEINPELSSRTENVLQKPIEIFEPNLEPNAATQRKKPSRGRKRGAGSNLVTGRISKRQSAPVRRSRRNVVLPLIEEESDQSTISFSLSFMSQCSPMNFDDSSCSSNQ